VTEFQEAAAAARRRYADTVWFTLSVNEQAKAIYAELRRLDDARVRAAVSRAKSRPRPRQRKPIPEAGPVAPIARGWAADGPEA
jgi:hypothetical protein